MTDPLAGLREQIRAATQAAEQLVHDAQEARLPGPDQPPPRPPPPRPRTPPAGWQQRAQAHEADTATELMSLIRLLKTLRDVLPPELRHEVTELLRQLLVVMRTLIDWLLTLLERDVRVGPVEVEDIAIE